MMKSFYEQLDWWTRILCSNTINLFPNVKHPDSFSVVRTDSYQEDDMMNAFSNPAQGGEHRRTPCALHRQWKSVP
jgi:hypothetical protein